MSINKKILLLIPDLLTARIFFDSNIIGKLNKSHANKLQVISDLPKSNFHTWLDTYPGLQFFSKENLKNNYDTKSKVSRVREFIDIFIDKHFGFFPLAIRFNEKYGFHKKRMCRGHKNWFLDIDRRGILPHGKITYNLMQNWIFSRFRYIDPAIEEYMRNDVSILLVSNLQYPTVTNYLAAARRLRIPIVGYVASWDHPVGKGVVAPFCERYIVQNKIMKTDLQTYHDIDPAKISITGWPQADIYSRQLPVRDYCKLIEGYGLFPSLPVVLLTGNTEINAPYETIFLRRFVEYCSRLPESEKFNLIFRPHPKDKGRMNEFRQIMSKQYCYIQEPSYTDISILALMLQHVSCVVTNAGTILLDSLANNRPVVCILYDEGSDNGYLHAVNNISGEHYKELVSSNSFYKAYTFSEVVNCVKICLNQPDELEGERKKICDEIYGNIDGKSSIRVVNAINQVCKNL
jgi:hypothetical protein